MSEKGNLSATARYSVVIRRSAANQSAAIRRSAANQSTAVRHSRTTPPIRQRRRKRSPFPSLAAKLLLCLLAIITFRQLLSFAAALWNSLPHTDNIHYTDSSLTGQTSSPADFSQELQKLLEINAEAADYVECYPNRDTYTNSTIDLTDDFVNGQVPLLMQWDKRWGYNAYGDSMIGLAGCGPLCMTQAYLYFTEDTDMNPRRMAEFAYDSGYYTSEGTSWSFWTEGAKKLGLSGSVLSLDENLMRRTLDAGNLIICSMGPGDFTTAGHFILIRGYDENGFYVNDPNRRTNSEKQWDYETLRSQIRNLWELSHPA